MKNLVSLLLSIALFQFNSVWGQERMFANYFDIETGSPAQAEVMGRIHLERNKDVLQCPVPPGYRFGIVDQKDGLFHIETRFDPQGRIMGVLITTKKLDDNMLGNYPLTVSLHDGEKKIGSVQVIVRVVKESLWRTLYQRYKDVTVSPEGNRMYGREIFQDDRVSVLIDELTKSNGRFNGFGFYNVPPRDYKSLGGKKIEHDWEQVAANIGGLGYAYARSKKYGPGGDPAARRELKQALYAAISAYTESVPVEGTDVVIDGKPIGRYTGDGFTNLLDHDVIENQVATHQWVISDALIAPAVHLAPDLLLDMKRGDKAATRVYYNLVRFFQTAMAEMNSRRAIDNPNERWGEIQDTLRSSGAWADANLGHRIRMLLAIPVIWADYNRPLTYVQYWYSDYYNGKPFKGFSYSPGWSPHGVIEDVPRWLTKFNVPAYRYVQSGFQPDGTISHHIANATDAAMVAYGFGWLTEGLTGFMQFRDTEYKLPARYYQFTADRLVNTYPKLIYKNRFDFLVAGRSYLEDLNRFVTKTFLGAFDALKASKSRDTRLSNEAELDAVYNRIKKNQFEYSGTDAYWVNEFLVHRRGEHEKPFYASVKLKSQRTVGAEDFGKVRKSWNAGYGVFQMKVRGDEYSEKVLSNFDWHMLPGITGEWRTDPMPARGGAQASLPGNNEVAGVTADGTSGVAIYHHLPRESYSAATALKSYHFMEDKLVALGSNIQRVRPGQQKEVVTCIDQSSFAGPLTLLRNGKTEVIQPSQSVDMEFDITSPAWLHIGEKGYIIFPRGTQKIIVKTGAAINITDTAIAGKMPGYIIAVSHGLQPRMDKDNGYAYCLVPNVLAEDMNAVLAKYKQELVYKIDAGVHGAYSRTEKTWQAAFLKPATITIGELTFTAEAPALVILRDNGNTWKLTVNNPAPSGNRQQLIVHTSQRLKAGKYNYMLGGIYPRNGEFVTLSPEGDGTRIVAELPDERDEAFYGYQSALYNAAPIVIEVPKEK